MEKGGWKGSVKGIKWKADGKAGPVNLGINFNSNYFKLDNHDIGQNETAFPD